MTKPKTTTELIKDFQRLHEEKAMLEQRIVELDVEMYALFREVAIRAKKSLDE